MFGVLATRLILRFSHGQLGLQHEVIRYFALDCAKLTFLGAVQIYLRQEEFQKWLQIRELRNGIRRRDLSAVCLHHAILLFAFEVFSFILALQGVQIPGLPGNECFSPT